MNEIAKLQGLPPDPEFIIELRAALAANDEWPTVTSRARVIEAAKVVLRQHESQALMVAHQLREMHGGGSFTMGPGGVMAYMADKTDLREAADRAEHNS